MRRKANFFPHLLLLLPLFRNASNCASTLIDNRVWRLWTCLTASTSNWAIWVLIRSTLSDASAVVWPQQEAAGFNPHLNEDGTTFNLMSQKTDSHLVSWTSSMRLKVPGQKFMEVLFVNRQNSAGHGVRMAVSYKRVRCHKVFHWQFFSLTQRGRLKVTNWSVASVFGPETSLGWREGVCLPTRSHSVSPCVQLNIRLFNFEDPINISPLWRQRY